MNLFVVGWGLSAERIRRVAIELGQTARLYPQLDHASQWFEELPGGVLVGGVSSPANMAAPRNYVHTDDEAVVMFDGLPLDPSGAIAAHRAEALAANWPRLPEILEGRFGIVKVSRQRPAIELIGDALGVEQLYVHESGGTSLVSNSAGLVQRALDATEPDPLGVSLFLTLDWVGSDRTLRRGVRVAPGAQHWTWREGETSWTKRTYWSLARAGAPVRTVDADLVARVVDDVSRFCAAAAAVTGSLNAPLTGGKDSRMLAAVLMTAGLPVRYWTKGDEGSLDLDIARQLAAKFSLPHQFSNRPTQRDLGRDPTQDVALEWQALVPPFVAQNDGLASLFLIGNIQGQPSQVDRLSVTLSAMCAESARGADGQSYLCSPDATIERMLRYLPYTTVGHPRGLVSADAFNLAAGHVRKTTKRLFDEGGAVVNLPHLFYLEERCRRWASNNPRELAQTEDKVLPFLTRPYVEAAMSMRPEERAKQRLHREVTRTLFPGLDNDPPLDVPWRDTFAWASRARYVRNEIMPRVPYVAWRALAEIRERTWPVTVARAPTSPYDEESWLEANLGWARDLCLSQARSPLWDFLNRRKFERLMADRTPMEERRWYQLPLFAAITMFEFERLEGSLRAAPKVGASARKAAIRAAATGRRGESASD